MYFMWVSCQTIMSDKSLSTPDKLKLWTETRSAFNGPIGTDGGSRQPPGPLAGSWSVIDPRTGTPFATVELGSYGDFKSGSFGRNYGGPNGLGANRYIIENGLLKFVYIVPGRARVDEMLVGSIRKISDDEFQIYGSGRLLRKREPQYDVYI
jgi:hypothetical protein